MSYESQVEELRQYGCDSPTGFMKSDIPRYADFYGTDFNGAYDAILAQVVALHEVRSTNFQDLLESGVAAKAIADATESNRQRHFGEAPVIVLDNYAARLKPQSSDQVKNGVSAETEDPEIPLIVCNFTTMDDDPYRDIIVMMIGRPNSDGLLWLAEGCAQQDYDVVAGCFKRLLGLKTSSTAPHISPWLDHIRVPHTLDRSDEYRFDPNRVRNRPVDYVGLL